MNSKPFIVAELSANHNGSIARAYDIIDAAHAAGADAIKFQTFDPAGMAIPGYKIKSGPWEGRELRNLYYEAHTPFCWHKSLFDYTRTIGIEPISSPFDLESLELLEGLGCTRYKIASFELVDLQLIEAVAKTGKPLIISTGMAELHEIRAAVNTARNNGCEDLTLLHCVSSYPTPLDQVNLRTMEALRRFDCKIGLSDHTLGTAVSVAATTLGADVIEKHLTLSRADGGLDSGFSIEPKEFKQLVDDCRAVSSAMGEIKFGGDASLRRSLYYSTDIPKGTKIKKSHLKTLRPALGASPLRIDQVIGQILKTNVRENDPVQIY